ncbi:MAG: Hsp20/alpha crystallin family protein [Idiomarina sp.]|nr:Hsp20/alpha crystallin family protein [Idiomarina sp.]
MKQKSWSESTLAPWNWFSNENKEQEVSTQTHPISQFHRDIDRMFEGTLRALNVPGLFDPGAVEKSLVDGSAILRPSLDIKEKNSHYEVTVELAGVSKDDVKVSVDGNVLTVSGHKKHESESTDDDGKYHRIERSYGSFSRTLTLPDDADLSGIDAQFKEGVLRIEVKRTTDKRTSAKQIPIKN